MSEVKKIATRASYGNALVELGKKHDDLVVLDADLAAATQTGIFKKAFPELPESQQLEKCLSQVLLLCLLQDVLLSRFATLLDIRS